MTLPNTLPDLIPLEEIKAARKRIKGKVNRTPLIRLYHDEFPGEIYLKLETHHGKAVLKAFGLLFL